MAQASTLLSEQKTFGKSYPTRCYRPAKLTYKQAVIYRQDNFPRERMYQIYSPKSSVELQDTRARAFNIRSIPMKPNLMVSNLPMDERARMQCYNIQCSHADYVKMVNAPKYIFDTYHFNYRTGNQCRIFSKTFYYCIAPTLDTEGKSLPILYRLGIGREIGNDEHYTFSLYAVAGGFEDGFYFLARMDSDNPSHAHTQKPQLKSAEKVNPARVNKNMDSYSNKKVPFPHIHRPIFDDESRDLRELSEPKFIPSLVKSNFGKRLDVFLDIFNISPDMILIQNNCKITEVLENAKIHHYELEKGHDSEISPMFDKLEFQKYAYCSDFGQSDRYIENIEQKTGGPYLKR